MNSVGSRSRHPAWATQSVALLRPWFIGTRSACAGGPTSKPPPHRIDSKLPAARVKRSQCRGRYSVAPTTDPKPETTCTFAQAPVDALCSARCPHPGHRAENRGQLIDLQVRDLLGRRHRAQSQQLRRAPGRTAIARPGPDAKRRVRTPVALHGQSPRPAQKRDFRAVLAAGWTLLRARSSALVAAWRGQPRVEVTGPGSCRYALGPR